MNKTLNLLCADLTGIRRCLLDREREIEWSDRVALAALLVEFEGYLIYTMGDPDSPWYKAPDTKVVDRPTQDA
jgi:hypothetical protein